MSISDSTKQLVRKRAKFACEYCGVSEQNAGGELTIDHFRPQSRGGGDEIENLVYCCIRCNLYKSDFWIEHETNLWNPRQDAAQNHFWCAEDGVLYALTEEGSLSIRILKLNRPQLVIYRRQRRLSIEERLLLEESEAVFEILFRLTEKQREIMRTQQNLLEEQRQLLNLLLKNL